MRISLLKPNHRHKEAVLAYKKAFLDVGDDLAGTAGLAHADSYASWLQGVRLNLDETTVPNGFVPATTLLAFHHDQLVGMIDIRHRLNDFLIQFGGHIGYSVHPSHRRKGIGKAMLLEALNICCKMNVFRVLITCDHQNEGSKGVILACGGILENVVDKGESKTARYWIDLTQG